MEEDVLEWRRGKSRKRRKRRRRSWKNSVDLSKEEEVEEVDD